VFHISILWGLEFCWGAKPTKAPVAMGLVKTLVVFWKRKCNQACSEKIWNQYENI